VTTPTAPDRILRVELPAERVRSEPVPEQWYRRYLGGKGLGARYLYDELDADTDPLGPGNVLCFLLGPLSGYLPGGTRYAAVTKSPLTGLFLDSYAGGEFPARLAGALRDHVGLLVTGRAERPVRLVVADGDASVEPAATWGKDAVETARAFPDASVACIGPAGENRVAYATIASDEAEHHAGRGGAGAVMGAKRLKAVVARGDPPTPDASLSDLRERARERFADGDTGRWLEASGTVETVDFADAADVLAARGWQERGFEGAADVGVEATREAATDREYDGEKARGFRVATEAGETVPRGATGMSLGAGLGIDDFDAVAALGERCNRLALDLISAGNALALAIRATEAGRLDRDLAFGDPDAARRLLSAIATRETTLGDTLADGVERAADRLGATDLIPTVKRLSLPGYDPRGAPSMALAYATSDRGGCHRRARPVEREAFDGPWSPSRAAAAVVAAQDARAVRWSLVADDFVGESLRAAPWLAAVDAPFDDLVRTGERIWTLVRLFNVREGVDRADDALPAPLATGPDSLDESRFEAMLDAYYRRRGWGADGRPARATLDRLDLTAVRDDDTPLSHSSPRADD
jgi:aldehyde:ferredoxin oxidoreductase